MGNKRRARISQCMIVKNEEKNIEKALSWGKSIMWEQIVVDTGSTDNTVELATKLGARVLHFTWIDDFSAAKNFAIEQARGEWIAFLDADEYMDPKDARKMERILERLTHDTFDAVSTGCQQVGDNGEIFLSATQVRFFRNRPDIRYRRRIHEQLVSDTGRSLRVGDASGEISVFHTGYQKKVVDEKNKNTRNRILIQKELELDPKNYEMMGYMGDECLGDGEDGEAALWYGRAIEAMPDRLEPCDQRSALTFTRMLTLLTRKGEDIWNDAEAVYKKAINLLPKEPDFDYVAGLYFARQGEAAEAAMYLEKALEKLSTYGYYNKALFLGANVSGAYELLTRCCFELGEFEKCLNYGVAYLKFDRYDMGVLSRVLRVLLPDGGEHGESSRAVFDFLAKLYDFGNLKDRVFVVKAAERSGCQGFAEYGSEHLFTEEEREKLGLKRGKEGGSS